MLLLQAEARVTELTRQVDSLQQELARERATKDSNSSRITALQQQLSEAAQHRVSALKSMCC